MSLYLGTISLGVPEALPHFEGGHREIELQNAEISDMGQCIVGRNWNHAYLFFCLKLYSSKSSSVVDVFLREHPHCQELNQVNNQFNQDSFLVFRNS